MDLEVVEVDLGGNGVGGYFYADYAEGVAGVALDPDGLEPAKAAYFVEAQGYLHSRPPKGGRRFMLESREVSELDENALLAIQSVIEELQPLWVAEVREACRLSNNLRVIAGWCDLSLAVVAAIVRILKARGEIPVDTEVA